MSEKRKSKKKGYQDDGSEKPSKLEYKVALYLINNLPIKEAKLMGNLVKYFTASKAIDVLMQSKFANADHKEFIFPNRYSCTDFMASLLCKELFHKADKLTSDKKKNKKKKKDDTDVNNEKSKKNLKKKNKEDCLLDSPKSKKDDDKKKEKKKKEVLMGMSEVQKFYDQSLAYYVWIYDPVPMKTKLIGLLLVIGAICICLFPLWPPEVRVGVYYLSIAGIAFVGVIISLSLIQRVLYTAIYISTFGKHTFWLLPNLTEDVSFLESFKPLYKHTVKGSKKKDSITTESANDNEAETIIAKDIEEIKDLNQSDQSNKSDDSFEIVDEDEFGDGLRSRNKEFVEKELKLEDIPTIVENKKHI